MNALPHFVATALVSAIAALALPAQVVWPANYTNTAGNAVMNAPFSAAAGPGTRTRCLVVLDPAQLPFGPGTTLTRLSFRRDSSYPGQAYPAISGALSIRMGRAIAAPDAIQDVRFARLLDGAPTLVFDATAQTPFTVPSVPATGGALPPFSVVVPFTTNFVYQGGPLAIDIQFTPTAGSPAWRVDAFAVPTTNNGSFRVTGRGCQGSNGFVPFHYALPETAAPGRTLQLQLEGSPRAATPGTLQDFTLHLLGTSGTQIGGVALPIDLGPILGTPNGCLLRTDVLLSSLIPISNPSTLFARARQQIAIPANAAFAGAQLYSQWLLFDLGLNTPFPATVSDGLEITLAPLPPPTAPRLARTIWKYGAAGNNVDSGRMVLDGYGPILRFN